MSGISDIELRELAGAAIEVGEYSGEWWTKEQLVTKHIDGDCAAFMAAASPDVVLDLIREREWAKKECEAWETAAALWNDSPRIWLFENAPAHLQELSEFGGDEEILVTLPLGTPFCDLDYWTHTLNRWHHEPQVTKLEFGIVLIFAH